MHPALMLSRRKLPTCGLEYTDDDHDLTELRQEDSAAFINKITYESFKIGGMDADYLPALNEYNASLFFSALFKIREFYILWGADWRTADLVRFGLDRTNFIPRFLRGLSPRILNQMAAVLIAARRRFIKITHRIQWTSCFGDPSPLLRTIDKYIGEKPVRTPDCLVWTPFHGHWSLERAMKRKRMREEAAASTRTPSRRALVSLRKRNDLQGLNFALMGDALTSRRGITGKNSDQEVQGNQSLRCPVGTVLKGWGSPL
jgi:hypothetical protein